MTIRYNYPEFKDINKANTTLLYEALKEIYDIDLCKWRKEK